MKTLRWLDVTKVVAALAACGIAGSAYADGPPGYSGGGYYAPSYYSWSGYYLGGQLGSMRSDIDGSFAFPPPATWEADRSVGIYGAQLGVQHQWGSLVLGLEADAIGTFNRGFGSDGCHPAVSCGAGLVMSGRLGNMLTIGPRIGWAMGQWMPYLTGGYASATVENRFSTAAGVVFESTRHRQSGSYLGGGVDWAMSGNWMLGLEYRHYDFNSKTLVPHTPGGAAVPFDTWTLDPSADTITLRLSYKFGRDEPVRPLK